MRRASRVSRISLSILLAAACLPGYATEHDGRMPSPANIVSVKASVAQKICQLVNEYDRERDEPTINRTRSRYGLAATDLGVPFRHGDKTFLLFGDTDGVQGGDAIAYTVDRNPEDCLELVFVHDDGGLYRPVLIPGIRQDGFEVPMEGTSVGDKMYVYHTTDSRPDFLMGRSVVAVSEDDGFTFNYLYDLSSKHFINVSVEEVDAESWPGLPRGEGPGLVMFGSGHYRKSDVRLAYQRAGAIETASGICFFAGLDRNSGPTWSCREEEAVALFDDPCVGELSVKFNSFIRKWILLYNCGKERQQIKLRTADRPWGPWSADQVIYDAARDGGDCRFIHVSFDTAKCDDLSDHSRERHTGDVYGPYQFGDLADGTGTSTTIYFTLSTWNPYTVVLMKTTLTLEGTGR